MRHNSARLASLILGVSLIFGLGLGAVLFATQFLNKEPPTSLREPPIYPVAQQIVMRNLGSSALPLLNVSYTTGADPPSVLAFYRAALIRDGWRDSVAAVPTATSEAFVWNYPFAGADVWSVKINAATEASKDTEVQLQLIRTPGQ